MLNQTLRSASDTADFTPETIHTGADGCDCVTIKLPEQMGQVVLVPSNMTKGERDKWAAFLEIDRRFI